MSNKNSEKLPKNSIEAQGLLIKAFYRKYGDEILTIIDNILSLQGRALGLKIKEKVPDTKLSTVAKAFVKNWDPKLVKVISISDEKFHIQGTKCPFGLENTSRKLCEAVMALYLLWRTIWKDCSLLLKSCPSTILMIKNL